ncbi:MAG TPA: hypothetical protein DEB39_02185 [Planctomycetaceae bacterium]|nr:hypothetical protein [Planctomycetaceae bacterium]
MSEADLSLPDRPGDGWPAAATDSAGETNGFPESFSFKDRLDTSPKSETWNIFDRARKKNLVLKRFDAATFGIDGGAGRFESDIRQLQALPAEAPFFRPLLYGKTDSWLWYVRDAGGTAKTLREWVVAGKSMRPFDVSKRFLPLCQLLIEMHRQGIVHRSIKPENIFLGPDSTILVDADVGHFHDPAVCPGMVESGVFNPSPFLAPEQRAVSELVGPAADIWSLAACIAYVVSKQEPDALAVDKLPVELRDVLLKALNESPGARFPSVEAFQDEMVKIGKATRPTLFGNEQENQNVPSPVPSTSGSTVPADTSTSGTSTSGTSTSEASASPMKGPVSVATPFGIVPSGEKCPHCHSPVVPAGRMCPKCNRPYEEPCLSCNTSNPFWAKQCRNCSADLAAAKQKTGVALKLQQQYVMKLRETYGHDKALPILKAISLVSHPDFVPQRDWAKMMIPIVQKERRDIRTYVESVRSQARTTFDAQKYDLVRKIVEQVPQPLVDEDLRKMYVEAGDCITEVDSLIREIRNAIATKQYSTLLSCVQRYLELKSNDPEARSLQEKIEKLTTVTTPIGMKLRRIPNGKFYMGSHESDEFIRNNERPQHRVSIAKTFLIGVYPVTQAEFFSVCEYNPSISTDQPRCPVDNVTWYGAVEFCNRLSEREGFPPYYTLADIKRRSSGMIERAEVSIAGGDGYRLPTEAEWEYSCRAGSITPWCFGDLVMEVGQYAWYFDNAQQETHPVGLKKPNSWGLYDLHGNVMEWCYDYFDEFYYQHSTDEEDPQGPEAGSTRVIRGGAWQFGAEATRSPYRNSYNPEQSSSVIGFRVVRAAPEGGL